MHLTGDQITKSSRRDRVYLVKMSGAVILAMNTNAPRAQFVVSAMEHEYQKAAAGYLKSPQQRLRSRLKLHP